MSWRTPTGEFGRREALNWKKEIRALAALKRPCPSSCVLPIRAVKGLDSSLDNGCALEASLFGHLRLDRRSHRVQRHVPGEVKAGISAWINKIGQSDEPALPAVSMNSRTPSA